MDRLRPYVRACLNGTRAHASVTIDAVNRRGKQITCRATMSRLLNRSGAIEGIILATEEVALPRSPTKRTAKKRR